MPKLLNNHNDDDKSKKKKKIIKRKPLENLIKGHKLIKHSLGRKVVKKRNSIVNKHGIETAIILTPPETGEPRPKD